MLTIRCEPDAGGADASSVFDTAPARRSRVGLTSVRALKPMVSSESTAVPLGHPWISLPDSMLGPLTERGFGAAATIVSSPRDRRPPITLEIASAKSPWPG
jgi:hypothetical protein